MNEKHNSNHFVKIGILLPLLLFMIYAPWSGRIDLWVSRKFYHSGQFETSPFLEWIYHYAIWPAWFLAGLALVIYILSFVVSRLRQWQRACLFLMLTMGIGAGIIGHVILKDHWGRPRPKQTIEFGGTQPFRAFYSPNVFHQPEPSKSFPCGHCTMGFYFFGLMLLGSYYRMRTIFWLGLVLAVGLGGLLGYARIAQGGHYLSDVIAAGLVMWLTALILYRYLLCTRFQDKRQRIRNKE